MKYSGTWVLLVNSSGTFEECRNQQVLNDEAFSLAGVAE